MTDMVISEAVSGNECDPVNLIASFWHQYMNGDSTGASASLRSDLRHENIPRIFSSPVVAGIMSDIASRTRYGDSGCSMRRVVTALELAASVRHDDRKTLMQILGGSSRKLSVIRFRKIIAADEPDLSLLRRAVMMAGNRCNVTSLTRNVLYWGERQKMAMSRDYFS